MFILGLLAAVLVMTGEAPADPRDGKTLVFQEEFNRYRDDVWSTRQPATTFSKPDPDCVRVVDSKLVLTVREDPDNPGHYLTGHIGTQGKREFDAYGYFEAKVKFPTEPGVLSAFWLQTTEDYIPGQSEIDVVENYGNRTVHHTIWFRDPGQLIGQFHQPAPHIDTDLGYRDAQAEFHRYGVLWEPDGYTFFVDDQPVGRLTEGLSARPKFLVLSMKVPDYLLDRLDPALIAAQRVRVKWVRVWQ
jgi:beta-glucanase (GH16 family)